MNSNEVQNQERMPTGLPGLDHLLCGGVVRGNSLLVEGPPGSGKTTLAVRMLFEGIVQYDEPGLIISFEEFPKQLYLEALAFGVDLRALEEAGKLRVIWTPPSRIMEGFAGKNDLVDKVIQELGVRRVLIDSITHFKRIAATERELREVLSGVLSNLKLRGVNAILTKELERMDDATIAFEEYLVDASMRLSNPSDNHSSGHQRTIEIRKTRGQPHIPGKHPFELSTKGPAVYPRLRSSDIEALFSSPAADVRERTGTGVPGLDLMLGGGFWRGSLNLLRGGAGTGKSVVAHHFLEAGMRAGERALLVSVRSTSEATLRQATSLGLDWTKRVAAEELTLLHYPSAELCPEKMIDELVRKLRTEHFERLVFDSVDDLWTATRSKDLVREYILVLAQLFQSSDTTSLMIRHDSGNKTGTSIDVSALVSCAIGLDMSDRAGVLRREVRVLKHAGSDHSKSILPYDIDDQGMQVELPVRKSKSKREAA